MYMMASAVHLMLNPIHLLANAGHPRKAPYEPDRICCALDCKCSTLSGAPDVLYMTVSTVHLMENAVYPSGAPDVLYMIVSTVHLMANAVHPSGTPEVQHGLCLLMANVVHPSVAPDVR